MIADRPAFQEIESIEPIVGLFTCAACQRPATRAWAGPHGEVLCAVDDAARLNPSAFSLWLKNEERARQAGIKRPVVRSSRRLSPQERGARISLGWARRRARLQAEGRWP